MDGGLSPPSYRTCWARDEIAVAQIYALQISLKPLDERHLGQLARAALFIRANFNPAEPRDWHGRWTGWGDVEPSAGTARPRIEPAAYHLPEQPSNGLEAYLIDAGYSLSTEMWKLPRDLYRLFMESGGDLAALRAYLADRGLKLSELPDVIRSLFDPPRPLGELQTTKPPRGFYSESELRAYLGLPPPGYEWHHLIEQNGQWRPELTTPEGIRTRIQHTDNMVLIPVIKHYCISGIMSRSSQWGGRVRDIVRHLSPEAQRQVGRDLLKACGVTR